MDIFVAHRTESGARCVLRMVIADNEPLPDVLHERTPLFVRDDGLVSFDSKDGTRTIVGYYGGVPDR